LINGKAQTFRVVGRFFSEVEEREVRELRAGWRRLKGGEGNEE
jgi:hypothetical protein